MRRLWKLSQVGGNGLNKKAEIARLLVSIVRRISWPDRLHLVHEKFGKAGNSKPRLKALLTAVKGVDPINYSGEVPMIICQCTYITDHDIHAAIDWMRAADPDAVITPCKIYHALGKTADCSG